MCIPKWKREMLAKERELQLTELKIRREELTSWLNEQGIYPPSRDDESSRSSGMITRIFRAVDGVLDVIFLGICLMFGGLFVYFLLKALIERL